MMNAQERFDAHVQEALPLKPVYVALQGSQNYRLDYEGSDVDSKAMTVPTLEDIVKNKKLVSYTHVRDNDEHIDVKDVRLMFDCFRKQNINFVEIIFSDYYWINPDFADEINELRVNAEAIARMDTYAAVKCMKGMAYEKYHALEHPYPAKATIIQEHGYDGKQLSHMVRIEEFLRKYLEGTPYKKCLISNQRERLITLKKHTLPLEQARQLAQQTLKNVDQLADNYCSFLMDREKYKNQKTFELLENIQFDIIRKALRQELQQER